MNEGKYNKSTFNDGYVGDEVEMETKIDITKVDAGVGFIFAEMLTVYHIHILIVSVVLKSRENILDSSEQITFAWTNLTVTVPESSRR